MLTTKKSCGIFFLLLFLFVRGNGQNIIGAGINAGFFDGAPGFEATPFVSFQHDKHRLLAGPEISNGCPFSIGVIVGAEMEYRYRIWRNKHLGFYADCDLNYVRFAVGPALPLPFHVQRGSCPEDYWSVFQTRVFNNTFGIGVNYFFGKRFDLFGVYGAGYNLYKRNITPGVVPIHADLRYLDEKHAFSFRINLGLSIDIFNVADKRN